MSTIEKAAAKLAGRAKADAKPSVVRAANGAVRERGSPLGAPGAARKHGPVDYFCDIDLDDLVARGFITPHTGRSQLSQEMRRIKRPLLLNVQKDEATRGVEHGTATGAPPANLIMITSALPGEGKTFISINLAMSMAAEVDRRVLLVDADIARGDISRQLHIEPRRGLSDLLQSTNYLNEDGVLTSNIERLSILPAGQPLDNVDELYASQLMLELTRALAEADPNRVVIFDASPLLATTEAAVLASLMGQTVLVVEANRTPQDAVVEALSQVEACSNVSLVLNKTTAKNASGYAYGYGYGYGTENPSTLNGDTQESKIG